MSDTPTTRTDGQGGLAEPIISHQTVRLARGAHRSPDRGVCVMELASMLAGEPFCDRPRTACPVIGAVLRTYNDACDDRRRQDLYPYAAAVVGTRASEEIERLRAQRCVQWAAERAEERGEATWWWRRGLLPWGRSARKVFRTRFSRVIRHPDDCLHRSVLRLVDELIAIGAPERPADFTAPKVELPELSLR